MRKPTPIECIISGLILLIVASPFAQALEVKVSSTPVVNILMRNASNLTQALTGGDNTTITVHYKHAGIGSTPMGGHAIVEADATNLPGLYNLTLPANVTNTSGELIIYANMTGSEMFRKTIDVVGNVEADTYAKADAINTTLADVPNTTEFEARTIAAGDYFVVGDYTAPDNDKITAINGTVNHATYGNSAINTKLGGLTNVTLNGTQNFNNSGTTNLNGTLSY